MKFRLKTNRSMRIIPAIATAVALHVGADLPSAAAQCQLAKLLASDGSSTDTFGVAVGVCGDVAVITAWDDDNGTDAGAAYVFRRNGSIWVEEAKLLASDGAPGDLFGTYVAISGDTVVIGAHYDDNRNGTNSGAAYVFRYNGSNWVEEAQLLASDGTTGDLFGTTVAISGDVILIGAQHNDGGCGADAGAAYVFRYDGSGWVEEAKLTASDCAAGDRFGIGVTISGGTAVIGADKDDDNGTDSGSAYVFRYNGSNWVEEAKLLASDGGPGDSFGDSTAVDGGVVVVSARYDESAAGSAYVFRYDGSNWVEEAKLAASDGAANDHFGCRIGISGGTAVIGAYWDDDKGTTSGSAYVFRYGGSSWVQEAKLLASDGAAGDSFGGSVGISGSTAVIAAFYDDDKGANSGSAYVFDVNCTGADLDADGDVDLTDFGMFSACFNGPNRPPACN